MHEYLSNPVTVTWLRHVHRSRLFRLFAQFTGTNAWVELDGCFRNNVRIDADPGHVGRLITPAPSEAMAAPGRGARANSEQVVPTAGEVARRRPRNTGYQLSQSTGSQTGRPIGPSQPACRRQEIDGLDISNRAKSA